MATPDLPTTNGNGHDSYDVDQLVKDAIIVVPEVESAPPPRKRLYHTSELSELPPTSYLIDGVVENGLSAVVGPSNAGKSFFVLDEIAFPVAKQHNVVYVAAEGISGYRKRTHAYCAHHKTDPGGLYFLSEPVNLLDNTQLETFVAEIEHLKPKLIIFDTLARCMVGGDENSAKDMGQFIAACDRVRIMTGATVLVVHHTGKKGDYRGSSAFEGAMDTMIELKNDDDTIEVSCYKIKDGEPFSPRSYKLIQVPGTDSCVLVPADRVVSTKSDRLSNGQYKLLRFLAVPIFEQPGARARDIEQAGILPRSSQFNVLSALLRRGYISQSQKGDPYHITDEGRAALQREQFADSPSQTHRPQSNSDLPHPTAQVQAVQAQSKVSSMDCESKSPTSPPSLLRGGTLGLDWTTSDSDSSPARQENGGQP